jgi:hypothetical protein
MAIKVAELVVWIILGFAIDVFSLLFASFRCLSLKKKREEEKLHIVKHIVGEHGFGATTSS